MRSSSIRILLAVLVAGCGAASPRRDVATTQPQAAKAAPTAATSESAQGGLLPRAEVSSVNDVHRLREIFQKRTNGAFEQDYPIGPGDLIELSVPAMVELDAEVVRVAGDGTVSLPLLGNIHASGKTERQLQQEIEKRLFQYMYQPEFTLLVKEHHNRSVGVLGAVQNPGLHSVESSGDTILEMISKAGGLTEQATQRLLFIPVEQVDSDEAVQLAKSGLVVNDAVPAAGIGSRASPLLLKAAQPIVVDLEKMNQQSQQLALSVPVRPGDTIMVAGGGQVFVQGWIEKPGGYPMTRGLTVLGAIAGAGGFSYPAKKNTVRVFREQAGSDQREVVTVDVESVEQGRGEDMALREGDIIEVESTGGKLAAYGIYHFFTNVMRTGLALSPF